MENEKKALICPIEIAIDHIIVFYEMFIPKNFITQFL